MLAERITTFFLFPRTVLCFKDFGGFLVGAGFNKNKSGQSGKKSKSGILTSSLMAVMKVTLKTKTKFKTSHCDDQEISSSFLGHAYSSFGWVTNMGEYLNR